MTAALKRPRRNRPKKTDRLMCPDASRAEQASDHAMAPFNRASDESDKIWGIDRLEQLVSSATAMRFGYALADLNAAYESSDPDKVVACANNAIKGLAVMDAEARALGHQPATGDFWEYEIDDGAGDPFRFAVLRDSHEWQTAQDKRPDLRFFTMREIGIALKALKIDNPIFAEVQKHFPSSEITSIAERAAKPIDWDYGDAIPF